MDLTPSRLKGKRKKKPKKEPNPLFLKWLQEWRDDAAAKGIQSQYTYAKALRTLKKYPCVLPTGKACKMLENFGDKICKLLDDKLAKHIEMYGSAAPIDDDDDEEDGYGALRVTAPKRRKGTSAPAVPSQSAFPDLAIPPPPAAPSGGSGGNQRKRRSTGREYIPAYRSGPYAIILALYRDQQRAGSLGYMTRKELVDKAQPLADASFTIPDPGMRYTAWSSMGTLINKGYVIKESSPAKYSISASGCELARKILAGEDQTATGTATDPVAMRFMIGAPPGGADVTTLSPPARSPKRSQTVSTGKQQGTKPSAVFSFESDPEYGSDGEDLPQISSLSPTTSSRQNSMPQAPDSLQYVYMNDQGKEVASKDQATVIIDEEISVGFLVKCKYTDLLMSGKRYKLEDKKVADGDFIFAYLYNEDCSERCSQPPILPQRSSSSTSCHGNGNYSNSSHSNSSHSNSSHSNKHSALPSAELLPTSTSLASRIMNNNNNLKKSLSSSSHTLDQVNSKTRKAISSISSHEPVDHDELPDLQPNSSASSQERAFSSVEAKPKAALSKVGSFDYETGSVISLFSHGSGKSGGEEDSQGSTVSSIAGYVAPPRFTLRPGEFEVVLCVDNCEHYGFGQDKKDLLPELIKNGVQCEVRKLQVGDFLWVAREKARSLPGVLQLAKREELVLDYIIERKRMDDLAGSIVDGRFKEQKFRLRHCGLRRPIYLVEDYGSAKHFSIPEDTLNQAIINTQVIDGFFVKRTRDCKESVAYLTLLSRHLSSYYSRKTLHACGQEQLHAMADSHDLGNAEEMLVTFNEFSQSTVKTKDLTVREMFGKQLMQLHGMTGEKVDALLQQFTSPVALATAYDLCANNTAREKLLANIKFGTFQRNLGAQLSRAVYQLYCTSEPLH